MARRVVAVLVVLLLIVLLAPRACQAILGSGEEPGPVAPDTSVTDTDEEAVDPEETVAQQEPRADEIEVERDLGRATDFEEEEPGEARDTVEVPVVLTGMNVEPVAPLFEDEGPVEEVSQPAPAPIIDTGTLQQEPPPVQPVPLAQPVSSQPPVAFEGPAFFEEPAFFGEPVLEEPVFLFQEPPVLEETASPERPGVGTTEAATAEGDSTSTADGGAVAIAGSAYASS